MEMGFNKTSSDYGSGKLLKSLYSGFAETQGLPVFSKNTVSKVVSTFRLQEVEHQTNIKVE